MNPRDRLKVALLLGCMLCLAPGCAGNASHISELPKDSRFAVYYGTAEPSAIHDWDVVVLDSDVDPAIVRNFSAKSLVLGYLSVGEVHGGRAYAPQIGREGLLLSANENWEGARFIDVRDARWKKRVVEELVPAIVARGFKGLFLDTLDSSAYLESSDPARNAGMTDAAIDLVAAIRQRFPNLPIMANRGYDLLPRLADKIDMLLGESVHTTYDAKSKNYVRVEPESVRWQHERMFEARRLNPSLRLFSLDYWSPSDREGIARIYAEARANGFVPYVATIDLSQIVPRP
ncbi:MAG: endo alpha-1,4 polygalactosaminidase [Burkholderiales bacterium]